MAHLIENLFSGFDGEKWCVVNKNGEEKWGGEEEFVSEFVRHDEVNC